MATAKPSKEIHHSTARAKPTSGRGGVEAITSQEPALKETGGAAGWNGAYVGVNAGGSFGATSGSNLVVPFGSPSK